MRLFPRLLALYRPAWGWALLGLAAGLAALVANVALMAASGWFITAMAVAGAAGGSLNYFTPAALIRALALIRSGGRYAERLISHETTFRLLARLRLWLYRQVEPQPPSALEGYHSGDLASRLRQDVDRLESVYLRVVQPLAAAAVACLLFLIWLGRISPSFALAEGLLLAVSGIALPLLLARLSARWGREQVPLSAALTETAVEAVQGMADLLAFGAARHRHAEKFAALSRELIRRQVKLAHAAGLSQAATLLGANLALWTVVVMAVPMVRDGRLDHADFTMAALFALAGFEAVSPVPAALRALSGVMESARRIFALADGCPPPAPRPAAPPPPGWDLRFERVTFGYRPGHPPVLDAFDLDVPQGARLAVLGPAGAGKSTLIALATGLRRPDGGQITLGGMPVAAYEPEALRGRFAVAQQTAVMFTGTVRDNLLLARPGATEAELRHVLNVAQLADVVADLPGGLDCALGAAGLTLSGGQARRLTIARALLKDAPLLILDEPGEGLDYRTEQALLRAVVEDLHGRSLILITHRLAGLDLMDRIVTLGAQPSAAAS